MRTYTRFLLWPVALFVPLLVFGLAFASVDAGVAPVATPVAPAAVKAAFNWTPFVPLFALVCGSFGAWLKAWTPSTGVFHTVWGHALVMLAAGLLAAGAAWATSGHLGSDSLLNGLIAAAIAWVSGLKPNGSDAAKTVFGYMRKQDVVRNPTVPGGVA